MILYAALVVSIVFASGTYLLLQRDLTRVVVGIILVSNSAVLFIIAAGLTPGEPPIYPLPEGGEQKRYMFAPKDPRDSTVWDLREQLRRADVVGASPGTR